MLMLIIVPLYKENIYCRISIHLMLMLIYIVLSHVFLPLHFNTSHVNVNHINSVDKSVSITYFNTSHVNVNLVRKEYKMNEDLYFNTSHVNVNPGKSISADKIGFISIHLMLMLIV